MIGGKDEVRCAIVDSGVQRELSGNNIFGGITFKRSEAGIEIIENEYQDENGHGSMVYRTLAQTDTEFYIVTFTAESAMWEIFPTIEELSDFLEEICTIFEINKYTVIFKRSMFVSIKKFSNTINIIKNGEKKYEN